MRIKKVSETTPIQAQVVDSLDGSSTTDAPSVHAVNEGINNLKPITLYNNTSGGTSPITLSDTYTNYKKIEIQTSIGVAILFPDVINTTCITRAVYYDTFYIEAMFLSFSDKTLTLSNSTYWYLNANHTLVNNKIYKVVGYK